MEKDRQLITAMQKIRAYMGEVESGEPELDRDALYGSLEVIKLLQGALNDLLYMDLMWADIDNLAQVINLRIEFIRQCLPLVEPSLQVLSEQVNMVEPD
jgi:hypothetical protein